MAGGGVGQNAILPYIRGARRTKVHQTALYAAGGRLDAEPVYQRESFPESPAIHVAVLPDVDPAAFRWVMVGAEEEGVPCREVPVQSRQEGSAEAGPRAFAGHDLRVKASAAAQESRLGVGIAVGRGGAVLHEAHMPVEHPVWELPLGEDLRPACRLVGGNAGRLVKRMPLRFEQESIQSMREGAPLALGETAVAAVPPGTPDPGMGAEYGSVYSASDLAAIVASIVRSLQERGVV
jgi:hypothetical protein